MSEREDPVAVVLARLRGRGVRPKSSATGWTARCPAHDDHVDSLKIDSGDVGVTLHCYAGCRTEDVAAELGLEMKDLFYDANTEQEPESTYNYTDEEGTTLYQVVRYPGKRFSQRRPGPFPDSWSWKLGDVRRVPYRLPQLLASSEVVYITEGEKDADAVVAVGAVATCAAGGASPSVWKLDWSPYFDGKHIVIVADGDDPGRKYAAHIYASLCKHAASVRVVEAAVGKDVSDHLDAGYALCDLVGSQRTTEPLVNFTVSTWEDFREQTHNAPEMLVDGLWSHGAFGFIAGAPKARKTWFGLGMALAVASGEDFMGWGVPEAQDVLYVALEGSHWAIRSRIGCLARGYQLDPERPIDRFHLMYRPPSMDLMRRECAEALRHAADKTQAKLVFVDVLRAATVFDENSASDFSKLMHNLRPMLNDGISIAMLHHFSKWGDTNASRSPGDRMVGTGAMRGALDVGLYLTQISGVTRVDSEARDLTMPDTFNWSLAGFGSGANGGFTYRDTCTLKLETGETMQKRAANAEDIARWILNNGGSAGPRVICAVFQLSDSSLRMIANDLASHGILPRGKGSNLVYEAVNQIGLTNADT